MTAPRLRASSPVLSRRRETRLRRTCLIYVATALLALLSRASDARADAPAKVVRGPYLQELEPTSVEIRAELDAPSGVVVTMTEPGDGGTTATRTVKDDARTTMHVVRVDHLRPATRYTYAIATGTPGDHGQTGELTTAPPNDSTAPFSFVVYGDNRTDDVSHAAIVRQMLVSPSDFLVNTGDLVQDGASDANWQTFFDVEGPLLRSRCVFACVGNHELTDGAGANYLRYFGPTSDGHGDGEKPKLYGSFRWASARFFLLDAMETFDSGPERAWLDDELTRADSEAGLVWRIVVMHHSPWSAGPHGGNARALRAGIPALFSAHKVDLILAGHDHIYERGFASGLRYVISGGGGAPLYGIENKLASSRKVESVHHVIEMAVDGSTAKLVAKRDDGSVLDRCSITKGRDGWDCDPAAPAQAEPAPSSPPARASRFGCASAPTGASGAPGVLVGLLALGACVRRRQLRAAD